MRDTVAALLARRRRWAVGAELVGYVDLAETDFGAAETFLVYSSPVAGLITGPPGRRPVLAS